MHRVPELVHVVVVAVLAPFAHADRLVRSLQLHDQARPVAPLHLVDLAVSLTVSDTLAHGLVHHLGRQREIGQTEPKKSRSSRKSSLQWKRWTSSRRMQGLQSSRMSRRRQNCDGCILWIEFSKMVERGE